MHNPHGQGVSKKAKQGARRRANIKELKKETDTLAASLRQARRSLAAMTSAFDMVSAQLKEELNKAELARIREEKAQARIANLIHENRQARAAAAEAAVPAIFEGVNAATGSVSYRVIPTEIYDVSEDVDVYDVSEQVNEVAVLLSGVKMEVA